MNKYNLKKLIKVRLLGAQPSWYEIREEKKFLGIIVRKAGIYNTMSFTDGDFYSKNKLPENHFIKDGKIYENPEVTLYYQDGIRKTYIFETFEAAKKFSDDITNSKNWID